MSLETNESLTLTCTPNCSSTVKSGCRVAKLTLQVAERIRVDERVTIRERTNLRYISLRDIPGRQPVQLATLDLSFISVLKVLPAVCSVLAPDGALIVLIKPQFEAGKSEVRRRRLRFTLPYLKPCLLHGRP